MHLNRTGMRVITFISVASFFIMIAVASAADFYVALTGSDETGDGSVDSPWRTIQHAVDNESVHGGDTIIVHDGTYTENVEVLGKSLTIRSDNGSAVTIVQAASASDHVFEISSGTNYVNISGLTIKGSTGAKSAGVHLIGVTNCSIRNNTVTNNFYGIWLDFSSDNNITCNWIHHNTKAGFYLSETMEFGSTNNTMERNNIIANGEYNVTTGGWEWQFHNDQWDDVAAQDNWWGAVDEAQINASIHDHYDDGSLGVVNFSDYRTDQAPCAPIPESAPILLFGAGLLALAGYVLREKR